MTTNYDSGFIYVEFDENNEMKYHEIINGVRIEFNTIDDIDIEDEEILNLNNINQHSDDNDNEFYDNRYWDDVNGVYTNRKKYDKDDVLLPNLNENYFAEQDEIKIKFPINDNNLHN